MKELLLLGMMLFQAAPVRSPATGISGQVTFADGMPAGNILVNPVAAAGSEPQPGASPLRGTRTDASGIYRISNLPPGRYIIRAGATGEAATFYPGTETEKDAAVVTIAPGGTTDKIDFALPAALSGVRLKGRVLYPAGQSPAGTPRVEIATFPAPLSGAIGPDGKFEILHVRPGRYNISVNPAPGMVPRNIVVASEDLSEIDLNVPRLVAVTGTVIGAGGTRPSFGLAVDGALYTTRFSVGADGKFTTQLPAGDYAFRTTGLPAGYYLKSFTTEKTDLLAGPLKVVDSDPAIPVQIALGVSPGVRVSGRVSLSRGESVAAIKSIELTGRADNQVLDETFNDDGSFQWEKVMPGAYFARATMMSGLASRLVPLVVPEKEVRDFQITIPSEIEVQGHVNVDGYGPPPKFSLLLIRGAVPTLQSAKPGEIPSLSSSEMLALTRNISGGNVQAIQVAIDALPDGSFSMKLPEGNYRLAASGPNGIPAAYVIRSLTYGAADLLKEPMKIPDVKPSEIQVGFGTTVSNPWVKLGGRVVGTDPIKGPFRVALEGRTTSTIETPVNADGTFEFQRVLPGTSYTARILPANDAARSASINVADKDVEGIEIVVPSEKEIRVVATVADNATIPGFVMSFATTGSTVTSVFKPERDGSSKMKLPLDSRSVKVSGFPLGYILKAVAYGSTDLLESPLRAVGDDTTELRVEFDLDPTVPSGDIHGRVIGLDPQRSGIRLALNGATSFTNFETAVGSQGAFAFSRIPQGSYVPTLIGAGYSGLLSPSTLTVSGSDLYGIEIVAPNTNARTERAPAETISTGAVVSGLGGSRESANEGSAVANLRTINTALITYLSANGGKYGGLPDLVKAGLLDSRFASAISGFNYSIISTGKEYAAAAIPLSATTARYGYYSTPDGIVRYSTLELLAPSRQGGNPVQ